MHGMARSDADRNLKVLILEDEVPDAELCEHELRRAGLRFVSRRVDTLAGLKLELERFGPDLILSDFSFPGGFDGMSALEEARRRSPEVPFIFVSGTIGEEHAVEAMRHGAVDYVLKDRMARLGPAVRHALELAQARRDKDAAERALRESEGKYSALIDQASDGIFVNDHEGKVLFWNARFREMLGYSEEEMQRLAMAETYPAAERHVFLTRLAQLPALGRRTLERMMVRKDGSAFPVEISVRHLPDRTHQGIARDITERKQQQDRIARLNRVRAVLSSINSAIVRFRDREALFEETCRIAVEVGNFGLAWIGLYDPATLDITPVSAAGLGTDEMKHSKATARPDVPQGQGALGRAIRERRPVFDNDISKEGGVGGRRRQEALRLGYRSLIVLPLYRQEAVVGILALFAKEPSFFDDEEVGLLAELAANLSFALEHLARQQQIEKLSRIRAVSSEINAAIVRSRNRQVLYYEACRIAIELGNFGLAWIGSYDSATKELTPAASAGLDGDTTLTTSRMVIGDAESAGSSMLAAAIRERRPVHNNDIVADADPGDERRQEAVRRGYRSVIVLPLQIEGAVVATLSMFAKEANFFDQEELKLLTELAGHISFAMEAIARRERIDRLSRIRAMTSAINATIVHARSGQELFEEACRIAVEDGRLASAWIGTLDAETLDITPVAWAGEGSEEMRTLKSTARDDPARGRGAVSRAVRSRQAVFNNDLASQGFGGPRLAAVLKLGFRSMISLPLFRGDTVAGTFTLYAREPGYFDDEEIALLTELAGNLSFALEHVAGQQRIEKMSRIRAVSSGINSAIVRIADRGTLLRETCRIAAELGRFDMVWVAELDDVAKQVRPVAWTGFSDEAAGAVSWASIITAKGTLGEAIATRRAAVRNDIGLLPSGLLGKEAVTAGHLSSVCMPLIVDDRVVGLVSLFAAGRGFFDADEMALLDEMAADVSFGLQSIAQREKVEYLSYYDAVTGLPNRALFIDRAGQQMRSRGGEPMMVALILLNLERFRHINDAFGRRGGDELLNLVAQRLEKAFRGKDYIARIGADGFGAVVRGIRDAEAVVRIVEDQVLDCFREPYLLDDRELRVGAKAGVALYPADGGDADTLFRNAEAALKRARDSGDRYLFYAAEMNARAAQVLSLETRLRVAVEQRQFVLHYQPKVGLGSGKDRVCGLEALIRWQEPGGELVPPGIFIPLLEETGLILEVGRWVLAQALADHRDWTARGIAVPRIAVNVSPIQLQQRDFAELVIGAVNQAGGRPGALELEVTESLLMKDVQESIRKLSVLRGVGIHIAMDDFGTGYSSLSYIARLPINSVKIDRSFITGMATSPQDMAIVTTIIALGHSLNLRVVAEGVETHAQAQLLALLKCDEAQGYLYSKPLPAGKIEPLLRGEGAPAA
jgi:diguanylate cyclase (GGDEF)-like protein/PAS domain S-box-containing protein